MPAVADVVAELDALLDRAGALDPAALADGETLVELQRQANRLEALVTRATAAFDAAKAFDDDGARSGAAWLATRCRMPMVTARRRVRPEGRPGSASFRTHVGPSRRFSARTTPSLYVSSVAAW